MKVKLREVNGAKYVLIPKYLRDELNFDKYVNLEFDSRKLNIIISKFKEEKIKNEV